MTKQEFREFLKNRLIFLDGATGSNLQKCGMPTGVCPELWITENPGVLLRLQQAYVEAGSHILYAPTFTANRIKLREFGLQDRLEELNSRLVAISKEAAAGRALVAGDITMTGQQLSPIGNLDFEELVTVYKEQISCLAAAGVDLLVIETMMSLQESRAALLAAKETCPELPVMVSMTFEPDGRSLFGTDAATAAMVLQSLGADVVGANCSTGPVQLAEIIRQMADCTRIPILAKPNAGLPVLDEEGRTVYSMGPEEFGAQIPLLVEAGASVLGGCCGTTPEHIQAMIRAVSHLFPRERRDSGRGYLTSERAHVSFGLEDPFLVVGERINPTGKKKLQEQLRSGEFELVTRFAQEQEEQGAAVLDVNMGMSGIDEKERMLQALEEISMVTNLPLSIDSSHLAVQEAALRRYPGRALINSISMEKEKLEGLLPLAHKYGAMFILLPLSDTGLPKDMEEKIQIIETIVARALELGMRKSDIIVDALVTTVGANQAAAMEALETIRYCKANGLATICGLSNISFGLPERSCVNTAFLTMAVGAGLTMAIANPGQEQLMAAAFAADMLMNKADSAVPYIEFANRMKERREKIPVCRPAAELTERKDGHPAPLQAAAYKTEEKTAPSGEKQQAADQVKTAVLKGNRRGIEALTQKALEAGVAANALLDDCLLPAINEVGELFDKGRYFLPQLIASAEAMKLSIAILEPLLRKEGDRQKMPVVVIATVAGDIHDIGKNLVVLMLRNYGFEVIDLGKDVPCETIVEAAIEHKAQIIALSALMTTTMQEMKRVIEYAKKRQVTAKIMIGGAVITQDYADEIGADGYSPDAAEAVKLAGKLLQLL